MEPQFAPTAAGLDESSIGDAPAFIDASAPRRHRPITKWSVLALIVMVSGTALTLGLDQAWLHTWSESGRKFPIGQRSTIQLPPGESLVWYESPYRVPVADVTLYMVDPNGDRITPAHPSGDISYTLMLGGMSGRALWKMNVPRAGTYEFTCFNHNFASDSQIPVEDRVVFLKTPDTLAEANLFRKFIQITGATASITLVIVFYVLHGLALRRLRLRAEAGET